MHSAELTLHVANRSAQLCNNHMRGIEAAFVARLGNDPEERVSAKGVVWCSFSAAVEGEAAFGDVATRVVAELRKGSRAYIEGELRLCEWREKHTGENRHSRLRRGASRRWG